MDFLGIDPWNDELAQRVRGVMQFILRAPTEDVIVGDHFPERKP
jgi:hypothetical protein